MMNKEDINIPLCWKCSSKIMRRDSKDNRCAEIIGCKDITKEEWEEGNKKGEQGFFYQHNCPLFK